MSSNFNSNQTIQIYRGITSAKKSDHPLYVRLKELVEQWESSPTAEPKRAVTVLGFAIIEQFEEIDSDNVQIFPQLSRDDSDMDLALLTQVKIFSLITLKLRKPLGHAEEIIVIY